MKNALLKICIPVFALFLFVGCEEGTAELDLAELGFTGSTADIQDFISEDVYDALIGLGLNVNPGSEPLNIEGTFRMEPYIRSASTSGGEIGAELSPFVVTFSNQSTDDLTVNYSSYQEGTDFSENGSGVITGTPNGDFNVFVRAISSNGSTTITAFSGIISQEGIFNYQDSFIIVGDDNPDNLGSLFTDGDGLGARQ